MRGELALAAYFSGLALANAGLGTVHGLAVPLGALSRAPHGVVCGLLLGPIFRCLFHLLGESPEGEHTLRAFESAGTSLFPGETNVDRMLDRCESWTDALPRLSSYGLSEEDLDAVVTALTNKSFPVRLSEDNRRAALGACRTYASRLDFCPFFPLPRCQNTHVAQLRLSFCRLASGKNHQKSP